MTKVKSLFDEEIKVKEVAEENSQLKIKIEELGKHAKQAR